MVYTSVSQLVGKTPMLQLVNYAKKHGLNAKILAKLEFLNPSGSVKDRAAKAMIENAELTGRLKKGGLIVEPTSGNTGIGIAAIAAAKGYKVIITMPQTMSAERRKMIKVYGAEIVLTDGAKGMKGAIEEAERLAEKLNGVMLGQFSNSANRTAHYTTTGSEIWRDSGGNVDIFVAGVGSGGTITGAGWYLREKNPDIKIIAVEPSASPVLSGGEAGAHGIQGIGAGFVPEILDTGIYDGIINVREDEAVETVRDLGETEGIFVGISSGAAVSAAKIIASLPENKGKTLVVILPDSGDRYLSVI